jgi:hypothetical protein
MNSTLFLWIGFALIFIAIALTKRAKINNQITSPSLREATCL